MHVARISAPWATSSRSVDPELVRSEHAVFSFNHRAVLTVHPASGCLGPVVYIVVVGASCVDSIELTVAPGQLLAKGQEIGSFHYGGSTVLTLVQPQHTRLHRYLQPDTIFTSPPTELYMEVGTPVLRKTCACVNPHV
jgi:phosphatidylserine decarboxylase